MQIQTYIKEFQSLTVEELYSILQLRADVFILEQDCAYLDPDGNDAAAYHILLVDENENRLMAYCRIIPPLPGGGGLSIGRVVTDKAYRQMGLAKQLLQYAIRVCKEKFPADVVKISAQYYLLDFYSRLGFCRTSEIYIEDDIPHISMELTHENR